MNLPDPTERRAEWGLLLIFATLSLGIVAGGAFYYRHYERQFRAAAERQLAAIAELKVGELAQYRKERLEDAAIFFNNTAFSGLVRRFLDHPEDAEAQQQIQEWIVKCMATDQYDLGCLFDAQGVIRLSVPAGRRQSLPMWPGAFRKFCDPVKSSFRISTATSMTSGSI